MYICLLLTRKHLENEYIRGENAQCCVYLSGLQHLMREQTFQQRIQQMMGTPKPANIHTQFRKNKMAGILGRETINA